MTDMNFLERNLLALSSHNTRLSFQIGTAKKSPGLEIVTSRSGHMVPVFIQGNRKLPLHSTFDPKREGNRYARMFPTGGFLVFLGFGAGYHILPFLERNYVSNIIVIDKDIGMFKTVLEAIDLRFLCLDRRVTFLIDYTTVQIQDYILSNYFPAVCGDLQTLHLLSRLQTEEDYFTDVMTVIKQTINTISDDYTVQVHFGKKWFKNTILNLPRAQLATTALPPVKKAIVTGAGPSLETQIPMIRKERSSSCLIATDTSLPALLTYDIKPDLVISIDCQHISYHHFLSGYPRDIPLVLDLASPPGLTRLTEKLVFFTSGHPLSRYVNANWRKFPFIDTSGGNVSHAAVSLADSLGAHEITLFGADFSFPEGKSYSRGTYIYPYFRIKEFRNIPLESQFFSFLLRNKNIEKEYDQDMIRYTTKPMISYKERLESAAASLSGRIIHSQGKGVPLNFPSKTPDRRNTKAFASLFAAGSPKSDWRVFLDQYNRQLHNLPEPSEPFTSYFYELEARERDLWTTLFPAVATFRQEYVNDGIDGIKLLKQVKRWSTALLGPVTT